VKEAFLNLQERSRVRPLAVVMANLSSKARQNADAAQHQRVGIGLFGRRIASSLIALARQPQVWISRLLDGGYRPDAYSTSLVPSDAGIYIENLSVAYGERLAVEDLTGRFAPGSLTAIVGPNGAGKSTLLKALAGILPPRTGKVSCAAATANLLAYLPQQSELNRDFPITVGELVTLGGWRSFGAFRRPPHPLADRVAEAISVTGLDGFTHRGIAELSVGELQRALFARLLLQDANVILLDEPFAAVDHRTTEDLLQLIERCHQDGRTVVAVLHDLDQVRDHFPTALLLARSCIAWGETSAVLTKDNLGRARNALERSNKA
jgi:zinc/manganese transport system ATP-binding protein